MAKVIRNTEEIQAQIKALKEIKFKVRRYSIFNDDNRACIDAQIWVLEEQAVHSMIEKRFGTEGDYILSSALEARVWMEGGKLESEFDDLVGEWRELAGE